MMMAADFYRGKLNLSTGKMILSYLYRGDRLTPRHYRLLDGVVFRYFFDEKVDGDMNFSLIY